MTTAMKKRDDDNTDDNDEHDGDAASEDCNGAKMMNPVQQGKSATTGESTMLHSPFGSCHLP